MICPQNTKIITLMFERRVRLAGYGFLEIIPKAIHGQTVDEEVSHDVCMSEGHSNSVVIKMKPPQLSGVHLDKVGGNEIDRNWQVRHDVDSCSEDHGNYSLPLQLGFSCSGFLPLSCRLSGLKEEVCCCEHDDDVWEHSDNYKTYR